MIICSCNALLVLKNYPLVLKSLLLQDKGIIWCYNILITFISRLLVSMKESISTERPSISTEESITEGEGYRRIESCVMRSC